MRKRARVQAHPDVVGLDLSLRSSAAVYIPGGWDPADEYTRWETIQSVTVGYPLKGRDPAERVQRIAHIADELTEWIGCVKDGEVFVYVEDLAMGLAARSGLDLAELSGAVKYAIRDKLGYVVVPVNQSTARKYLLGKLPPKDRGMAVAVALKNWGAEFPNSDEGDAFTICNWGRTEHGLPGLTLG